MASSSNLYTMGLMDKAIVTAVTSEAAGYPIENAFDGNPDTHWRPSSTANQTIDIDLGSAQSVDAFLIFIRNYDTDYDVGTQSIGLASDDNDNGAYSAVSYLGGSAALFDNTVGQPVWLAQSAGSVVTKRYWRITIGNMAAVAQIAGFYLCRTRAIGQGNQWPEEENDQFFSRIASGLSGRKLVQRRNSLPFGPFSRKYLINGSTIKSTIQSAFRESFGPAFPLIHNEGSIYRLVRFADDALVYNQVDYLLWEVMLNFLPIPYFKDGENY